MNGTKAKYEIQGLVDGQWDCSHVGTDHTTFDSRDEAEQAARALCDLWREEFERNHAEGQREFDGDKECETVEDTVRVVELEPQQVTLRMRDDSGAEETRDFDRRSDDVRSECRDWVEGGEWGNDGASVRVYWSLEDGDGDEIESGTETIDIEPDHDALIKAAGGNPDCDHDWTSAGEGGLDENPGVWSTGGTSMVFKSHCRRCGLRKTEHTTGSQRNPGEHDTVKYEMPDSWCSTCGSEGCECKPESRPTITQEMVEALETMTTRDEAGRHFTERFSDETLTALEYAGLIEITRPVHDKTGIPYDRSYWHVEVTEAGTDAVRYA